MISIPLKLYAVFYCLWSLGYLEAYTYMISKITFVPLEYKIKIKTNNFSNDIQKCKNVTTLKRELFS